MIPLDPSKFSQFRAALEAVPINTLFAQAVLDRKVDGNIYVDDPENPRAFYLLHPYGMSLLWGDSSNEKFNRQLGAYITSRQRKKEEWMQVFPDSWSPVLDGLFGDFRQVGFPAVERHIRVNFTFNPARYESLKVPVPVDAPLSLFPVDGATYQKMPGSVIPSAFWNNPDEFEKESVGYAVYYEGTLASLAFAAFRGPGVLEIGIETCESFRGKGLAYYGCAALVDYCVARQIEPVWACREGNTGSYRLALKLGFEVTKELPYYRIPLPG